MTPPTLRQRVRSAIRMFARAEGDGSAALAALEESIAEVGLYAVRQAADYMGLQDDGHNGAGPAPAQASISEMTREDAEGVLRGVLREMQESDGPALYSSRFEDAIETLVNTLPPVMGAKDAAEMLGMAVPNLRKLSPPLEPVEVVSGRIPLFLRSDVEAVARRRAAR
jgi:hypothetical protein